MTFRSISGTKQQQKKNVKEAHFAFPDIIYVPPSTPKQEMKTQTGKTLDLHILHVY